jgi:hypothetical protein
VEVHHLPELGHAPQDQDPAGTMDIILRFSIENGII